MILFNFKNKKLKLGSNCENVRNKKITKRVKKRQMT